jgi:hypothetical protein
VGREQGARYTRLPQQIAFGENATLDLRHRGAGYCDGPGVVTTRHRGVAQATVAASDAAADKISRVSATLDAKAPGKTRTVKSFIG